MDVNIVSSIALVYYKNIPSNDCICVVSCEVRSCEISNEVMYCLWPVLPYIIGKCASGEYCGACFFLCWSLLRDLVTYLGIDIST